MDRKKILIISPVINETGSVNSMLNYLEGVASHYDVEVLSFSNTTRTDLVDRDLSYTKIHFIQKCTIGFQKLCNFYQIFKLVLEKKIDLVLCNTSITFEAHFASCVTKTPLIVINREYYSMLSRYKILAKLKLKTLTVADTIICVSEANKKFLIERGLRENKIEVIYNGINVPAEYNQARREHFEPSVIGFVGKLDYRKGIDRILSLLQRESLIGKYKFVIIGELPEDFLNNNHVQLLVKNGTLEIIGKVHDVTEYYKQMDFLIQCSREEALPRVVLEAMSFGVIPICTNVGGTNELLRNDNLLISSDNFDATEVEKRISQFGDTAKKLQTAQQMYQRSLHFSQDVTNQAIVEEIRKLLH